MPLQCLLLRLNFSPSPQLQTPFNISLIIYLACKRLLTLPVLKNDSSMGFVQYDLRISWIMPSNIPELELSLQDHEYVIQLAKPTAVIFFASEIDNIILYQYLCRVYISIGPWCHATWNLDVWITLKSVLLSVWRHFPRGFSCTLTIPPPGVHPFTTPRNCMFLPGQYAINGNT